MIFCDDSLLNAQDMAAHGPDQRYRLRGGGEAWVFEHSGNLVELCFFDVGRHDFEAGHEAQILIFENLEGASYEND